jgi:hypothetical protein
MFVVAPDRIQCWAGAHNGLALSRTRRSIVIKDVLVLKYDSELEFLEVLEQLLHLLVVVHE